jgi:hypothetical protein
MLDPSAPDAARQAVNVTIVRICAKHLDQLGRPAPVSAKKGQFEFNVSGTGSCRENRGFAVGVSFCPAIMSLVAQGSAMGSAPLRQPASASVRNRRSTAAG